LITTALGNLGVYTNLRPPRNHSANVAVNNCSDNRTIFNKIKHIKRELQLDNDPVPVNCFGGIIRLSPHCPGYRKADARFMLDEFYTSIRALGVGIFYGGAHGDLCGWCNEQGITIAQRQWLSCDAKRVMLRAAENEQWVSDGKIKVCITWHRRFNQDGAEHQRTRVIGCRHPLFTEITMRQIMHMSDREVIEDIAPDLLDLVCTKS
jgi:hypothetical protein